MILKIIGLATLLTTFALIYLFETASTATGFMRLFHWPAILLTGVGPLGLMMVCSDLRSFFETFRSIFTRSPGRLRKSLELESTLYKDLSEQFYKEGAQAFEEASKQTGISYEFKYALERLSLRIPVADVRALIERDRENTEFELNRASSLLALAVKLSPSIGMLGTILGMVQLLSSLQNPSEIGSHMSLALLTTFYGLFFSLVLWTPLLHRIQLVLELESAGFEHLRHWLMLLENRKPSEYLKS